MIKPRFDGFFAHNSGDKDLVRQIKRYLEQLAKDRNIDLKIWLDEEQIGPGPILYQIQTGISESRCAVFFIGSNGSGLWQGNLELPAIVDLAIKSKIKLIPVLLPDLQEMPSDDEYLFLRTQFWIAFNRTDDTQSLSKLLNCITESSVPVEPIPPSLKIPEKYTRLRDLLAASSYYDADYATYEVMLQVVGSKSGNYIEKHQLSEFPCSELCMIDQLWNKYTNGHFGFTAQTEIYLEVGGTLDGVFDKDTWKRFGERVGWCINGQWKEYKELTFDISAPKGHLPVFKNFWDCYPQLKKSPLDRLIQEMGTRFQNWGGVMGGECLLQRIDYCNQICKQKRSL